MRITSREWRPFDTEAAQNPSGLGDPVAAGSPDLKPVTTPFDIPSFQARDPVKPVSLNVAPIVHAMDATLGPDVGAVAAGSLFTVTQPVLIKGAILTYRFSDTTAGGGHFEVNGVAQGSSFTVTADELRHTLYVAGDGSVDALTVQVSNGFGVSEIVSVQVTSAARVNHAPVVQPVVSAVPHDVGVEAGSLVKVTDADGDSMMLYRVRDDNPDGASGYWQMAGTGQKLAAGVTHELTAAEFHSLKWVGANTVNEAVDHVTVQAFDGKAWSEPAGFDLRTPANRAPVVTAQDFLIADGESRSLESLFQAADADGDGITHVAVVDNTVGGGHWVVNGQPKLQGAYIDVPVSELGSVFFEGGTPGSVDSLQIRVFDGQHWSDPWIYFTATTVPGSFASLPGWVI